MLKDEIRKKKVITHNDKKKNKGEKSINQRDKIFQFESLIEVKNSFNKQKNEIKIMRVKLKKIN